MEGIILSFEDHLYQERRIVLDPGDVRVEPAIRQKKETRYGPLRGY